MRDFKPLNERELSVIEKARRAMDEDKSIPCTACRCCTEGCPMSIPIPEIFKVKNDVLCYHPWDGGKGAYAVATQGKGRLRTASPAASARPPARLREGAGPWRFQP